MSHEDVLKCFKAQFPEVSKNIDIWFPNGKNSIRVRNSYGSDFIFTFNSIMDWCYETVESHIKKMRGATNLKC